MEANPWAENYAPTVPDMQTRGKINPRSFLIRCGGSFAWIAP
jgi:hypothetical protein